MSRREKREAALVATAVREASKELAATTAKMTPAEAQQIIDERAMERERMRRGRVTFRLRRHLYPWKAALVLLALAAVLWFVNWVNGAAGIIAALVFVLGAAGRAWYWSEHAGQWAARVRLGGAMGITWLITAVIVGPSFGILLLLVLATVSVSLGYWRATALGDDEEERVVNTESIPVLWRDHIADKGGSLPGSTLFGDPDTSHADRVRYTVQLLRGRQTISTALVNIDKISSGLDVPVRNLVLEPHPNESPSQLRMTVVTRSPISKTVNYTGPRTSGGVILPGAFEDPTVPIPDPAVIHLGPYADGDGYASWRLWTQGEVLNGGSPWGGFIGGGMGVGKSRTLELLSIGAMSFGFVETWFLDPQNGASSPALRESSDWYGDTSDAETLLEALEGFCDIRGSEMSDAGWIGYDPSPERPLLMVVIDECHEVFGIKEHQQRWVDVARKIRKVGGALVCLSQYFGLATFGGREELRSSIFAGNIIVMRSESKHSGQLVPGLDLDPLSLPPLQGFGLTIARGGSGARTAPFRAEYVKDPGAWLRMYPGPGLDRLAIEGCGDIYKNRHALAQEKKAQLRETIELIRAGHAPRTQDTVLTKRKPAQSTDGDTWFKPVVFAPVAKVLQLVREPVEDAAALAGRSARQKIIAHLTETGIAQKAELIKAANVSEVRTRQILDKLMEQGLAERAEHGFYRLTHRNRGTR